MNVTRTQLGRPSAYTLPAKESTTSEKETPTDSFTFSRGHLDDFSLGGGIIYSFGLGLFGAAPGVGAISSFRESREAESWGNTTASKTFKVSSLLNIAGTASFVGGTLLGNGVAENVGLGLLGAAGATAVFAAIS